MSNSAKILTVLIWITVLWNMIIIGGHHINFMVMQTQEQKSSVYHKLLLSFKVFVSFLAVSHTHYIISFKIQGDSSKEDLEMGLLVTSEVSNGSYYVIEHSIQ